MKFETRVRILSNSMEFTHGIRRALISALALVYFLSLGFNIVWVTTLFAISTIMMTFFEFPTSAIADYDSRKKSLLISFLLFSISFFGIFLFNNFWVLAAFWILGDIAFTFSTGARDAWVIDALDAGKNQSLLVRLGSQSAMSERAGQILGGMIGFLIIALEFRLIWLVIAMANFLMFLITWKYVEERNFYPEKVSHHYLKKVLLKAKDSFSYILHVSNKELRVLMCANIIGVVAISAFMVVLPLFFIQELGMDTKFLPTLYATIAVLTLAAPYFAEKSALKKGFRYSLFFIWLGIGLAIMIFGLSNLPILSVICLACVQFAETMSGIVEGAAMQYEFSSKIRASLGSVSSINWAISNSVAVFLAGLGVAFLGIVPVILISGVLAMIAGSIYLSTNSNEAAERTYTTPSRLRERM
jgi:MFS family permease